MKLGCAITKPIKLILNVLGNIMLISNVLFEIVEGLGSSSQLVIFGSTVSSSKPYRVTPHVEGLNVTIQKARLKPF